MLVESFYRRSPDGKFISAGYVEATVEQYLEVVEVSQLPLWTVPYRTPAIISNEDGILKIGFFNEIGVMQNYDTIIEEEGEINQLRGKIRQCTDEERQEAKGH